MGAFYILGIVKRFEADSTQPLDQAKWNQYLNERLDAEQYITNLTDFTVKGKLKEGVFEENIEDLYNKLVAIVGDDKIATYLNDSGTDIEKYQVRDTMMRFDYHDVHISIFATIAILFIEGKVFVEEFSFEPKLMNWLFRHTDISNPLAGCVMNDVQE